ncbi:MAG: amidohydrolase [Bacteroidetes bacterium]|nr:MAG: amidohydrolase [Bacteroidota bacterium]
MKNIILLALVVLCTFSTTIAQKWTGNKEAVAASVDAHAQDLIAISDQIWAYAETALEEVKSAKALADFAESQGFTVERGVAEMPTAFIASYGSGKPVIAILGEFDALPGLSQKAVPGKDPLNAGAPGHGCGHNMFGTGSLGAAIAIKELIEAGEIKGTVRMYGTPAEETLFGKLYFTRGGYFDDVDVCIDWHPSAEISSNVQSSKALVDFTVEFHGQAAHASGDPWNGRSALDALEFFTNGLNYQREHMKPTVRIHYQIMNGGDVVNVVPDYARVWTRVRDSKAGDVLKHWERLKQIAAGAAMMANVDYEIKLISGLHEVVPNRIGGAKLQANLELLGDIEYTEEEVAFAHGIQDATGKPLTGIRGEVNPLKETKEHPSGGSTDVGDVSWVVPEIRLGVTTAAEDTPWHSWAVVACGGMSIGHKGMIYAAKALAMTMVDVFEDEQLRKDIRAEWVERVGDYEYAPIVPEGPPPVPDHVMEAGEN